MIEFKGKYYPLSKTDAVDALVQFDGILIHVWHLSEPFHRLFSSDEFRLDRSIFNSTPILKLPNGGHIKTDDNQALTQLALNHHCDSYTDSCLVRQNWVFVLLGSITLVLGALWLVRNGLLF